MASSAMYSLSRLAPLLAAVASSSACVRDPLPGACPELAPGDLVITELRAKQKGSYRPWIELYNASGAAIELGGVRVAMRPSDGTGTSYAILVRDSQLVVEPGAYVVLGGGDPAVFPEIDYDITTDLHDSDDASVAGDLPEGAIYELYSCDTAIDLVVVRTLPSPGTLFWPGAPDADGNDDTDRGWCLDESGEGSSDGVRGTPGEANPACA